MSAIDPILVDETSLVLVDLQTTFVEQAFGDSGPVMARVERLLGLAAMTAMPVLATLERPTDEKGPLHPCVVARLPRCAIRLEKSTFDATREPSIAATLDTMPRPHVLVAGTETDVCVLLTVLGLLRLGRRVSVVTDCLLTSESDPSAALRRMEAAGAVPTTYKSLAYELTATVDRGRWPSAWRERLAADPSIFPPPEDLPPIT